MIWVAVPLTAFAIFALGAGVVGFAMGGALGYGVSLGLAAIFPAKRLFPYARS